MWKNAIYDVILLNDHSFSVLLLADGYAMLMRPKKANTAVHGCHCLGDMAVRMRKLLARSCVVVRVCHLLLLLSSLRSIQGKNGGVEILFLLPHPLPFMACYAG